MNLEAEDSGRGEGRVGPSLRLLLVEDEPTTREPLAHALAEDGHDVTAVGSAEEGLALLRVRRFHCILSDCVLAGGSSGLWMLAEAANGGYLRGTPILLITGGPAPSPMPGVRVLRKPLALELLRHELDELTRGLSREEIQNPFRPPAIAPRAELVLYVEKGAPSSSGALKTLKLLLADYEPKDVGLTVCDVSDDDGRRLALVSNVFLIPALVEVRPAQHTWLLANEITPRAIAALVEGTGVRPRDVRAPGFRQLERHLREDGPRSP